MIKSIYDLKIYQSAYDLALKIHKLSIDFPKEEKYSLTDQIRRSSRSVAMNIREGFAKRKYENIFIRHLVDALGSSKETRGWLNFSKDLGYIEDKVFIEMDNCYDQLNSKLHKTITTWKTF
jgi:four helix bundle protein